MNIRESDIPNIKKIGIYCITNLINNKKYVGQTSNKKGFLKRWKDHYNDLNANKHINDYLQKSWNKYGKNNFEFSILEIVDVNNKSLLCGREQYWMNYYDVSNKNKGYNICPSSESTKGAEFYNEEWKQKISEGNKGKHEGSLSEEHKKHISEAWTEERKELLSKRMLGRVSPLKGIPMKQESKEKMIKTVVENGIQAGINNPAHRSVICLNEDGTIYNTYTYINEVIKDNFRPSSVSSCCRHESKTHKGKIFMYIEEYYTGEFKINKKHHYTENNPNTIKIVGTNILTNEKIYFDSLCKAQKAGFDRHVIKKCIDNNYANGGKNKNEYKGIIWERRN